MTPFEILDALEAGRWDVYVLDHSLVSGQALPPVLHAELGRRHKEVRALVRQFGIRRGYHKIGTWHVAVNRGHYLETACRISLADQRIASLATDLPRPDLERRELLCQRCAARHVARELARLPGVSRGREERV